MSRPATVILIVVGYGLLSACLAPESLGQLIPYDPYAENQLNVAPVAADGTLHWGPFYKSASIQQSYERLWGLGACRGTNRAITNPVQRNKLLIDNLPEGSFSGRVRGAAGTLAGGLIAFTEGTGLTDEASVLVAQLHPAGVTRLQVQGPLSLALIKPGMTVRVRAQVDSKGRASAPVHSLEIVAPPTDASADSLRPDVMTTIVADVQRVQDRWLLLRARGGSIRRLTIPLAAEASLTAAAAERLDLIAPGDSLEVTGRKWSGDGCMGIGTIFASRISVQKASPANAISTPSAPLAASAR